MQDLMSKQSAMAKCRIKIDVGGQLFTASKETFWKSDTFLKLEDSFFFAMLSSGRWEPDEDGTYFINHSPTYFHYMIDYLRTGSPVSTSKLSKVKLQCVKTEFDFYQIDFPLTSTHLALKKNTDETVPKSELQSSEFKLQSSVDTVISVYRKVKEEIAELDHKIAVCLFCRSACLVVLSVNACDFLEFACLCTCLVGLSVRVCLCVL
jgi:hypothetical protein